MFVHASSVLETSEVRGECKNAVAVGLINHSIDAVALPDELVSICDVGRSFTAVDARKKLIDE